MSRAVRRHQPDARAGLPLGPMSAKAARALSLDRPSRGYAAIRSSADRHSPRRHLLDRAIASSLTVSSKGGHLIDLPSRPSAIDPLPCSTCRLTTAYHPARRYPQILVEPTCPQLLAVFGRHRDRRAHFERLVELTKLASRISRPTSWPMPRFHRDRAQGRSIRRSAQPPCPAGTCSAASSTSTARGRRGTLKSRRRCDPPLRDGTSPHTHTPAHSGDQVA